MGSSYYKAAIYRDKGSVDVVELPYPSCGDNDIIIRNLLAGVCGTDIAAFRNGDPRPVWKGSEFGHEVVSEVVQVGANVTGISIGDRVFPNLGHAIGDTRRMSNVGAFSEYLKIPNCQVGMSVLKLDAEIPTETAVLLEPFLVGARGVVGLKPSAKQTAVVFGAGIIGMAAAIMLWWYGCEKVMVVDISEYRLANAKKFGLLTCNPNQESLLAVAQQQLGQTVGSFGERCAADIYVDALSHPVAIENFTAMAKRDAHLAVLGVHHQPVAFDLKALCYNNGHIHGCGNTPNEEIYLDVLALMKSKRFDLASLVSHEYPIEKICDALVMGRNAGEAQKVCIRYA